MTRHFRAVAPAAALLAVFFATTPGAEEATKALFWIEQTELNLGTVVAGSIATATFVFHNDGPVDVNIIRAKPS